MSHRQTRFQNLFLIALILLAVITAVRFINASPAEAAEQNPDTQIEDLTRQIEEMNRLIEELSGNDQHMLVIRIDQECFGGAATIQSTILQLPVDRNFFDQCVVGQDITESPQIHLLSSSLLAETRIYVEDKFVVTR